MKLTSYIVVPDSPDPPNGQTALVNNSQLPPANLIDNSNLCMLIFN